MAFIPVLETLNALLVGVWVGMYLFTTFVVSPAFKQIFPEATERNANRRKVGRIYARVNALPTAALFLGVAGLGLGRGWSPALVAELALLVLIGGLVALHVRLGEDVAPPPAWITHSTLLAVVLLCLAALVA